MNRTAAFKITLDPDAPNQQRAIAQITKLIQDKKYKQQLEIQIVGRFDNRQIQEATTSGLTAQLWYQTDSEQGIEHITDEHIEKALELIADQHNQSTEDDNDYRYEPAPLEEIDHDEIHKLALMVSQEWIKNDWEEDDATLIGIPDFEEENIEQYLARWEITPEDILIVP